jgi:hypothetical protein
MIGFVQEKLAEQFDHLDGREDIEIGSLLDRLKRVTWNDSSNPAGWLAYVRKAIHRATVRALAKQRLMPEEKNCGTCVHLLNSNPRMCQMLGERKNVRDRACDHYHFLPITIGSGSENGFDDLGGESEANFSPAAIERSEKTQESVDARMDLESLRVALAKRVEKEKQGTKRRVKAARQYESFVILCRLLGEVDSDRDAFRILSQQLGVDQRTVRRDIADIRDFFRSLWQPKVRKK